MEEDHDLSMNSMMRSRDQESPEESSWTMYLQDFLISNNQADHDDDGGSSFCSSGYENYSIISDAASSVTGKLSTINGQVLGCGGMNGSCNNRYKFIKRKTKEALLDDALEDTATSPVNSPKVCNLSQSDMKPNFQKDNMHISKEKGSTSGRVDERTSALGFIGRESDCTQLKKRGLCLVPFSMVPNYFG